MLESLGPQTGPWGCLRPLAALLITWKATSRLLAVRECSSQGRPLSQSPFLPGLDLLPLFVTFLLCFWEVQYGILAGTLVSVLILLHSAARPNVQVPPHPGSPAGATGLRPRG